MPVKLGRLKREEENYIWAHAGKLVPQEIADQLNRSIRQVLNVLAKAPSKKEIKDDSNKSALRKGLKESALWKNLKAELDPDELEYFEEQYISLMDQFKAEEVLPTEENQVFKVIKIDILKHRNAVRQKRCMHEINRLERLHERIVKSKDNEKLDDSDLAKLESISLQINNLYAQQSGFSNEYVRLEEKHQKLMIDLKATREQRVDQIESGKMDFLSLLRSLGNEKIVNENERYIELMRRSTKNELERLSKPHSYSNNELDLPILNSETIMEVED